MKHLLFCTFPLLIFYWENANLLTRNECNSRAETSKRKYHLHRPGWINFKSSPSSVRKKVVLEIGDHRVCPAVNPLKMNCTKGQKKCNYHAICKLFGKREVTGKSFLLLLLMSDSSQLFFPHHHLTKPLYHLVKHH